VAGASDEKAAPPWGVSRPPYDEDDLDDEDDDEPGRRIHPYTWLHVLILAAVAFVLGFLIMLLYIRTRGADGAAEAAAAVSGWVTSRAGPL